MTNVKKKMGLCLGGLLFAVLIAEILLRVAPPAPVYARTRNIVQKHFSEPHADPTLQYVPKSGTTGIFSNPEFRTKIRINSVHMRDQEYPFERGDSSRILAMGDSFIFGWGVEQDEGVTELLEFQHLGNVEVLNMGVSGYQAGQQLRRLEIEGIRFEPDLVLFFVYGYPVEGRTDYYFENGKLYWHSRLNASRWGLLNHWLQHHSYFYALFYEGYTQLRYRYLASFLDPQLELSDEDQDIEDDEQSERESLEGEKILRDLSQLAITYKFDPVVVYIPYKHEVLEERPFSHTIALRSLCASLGIKMLDLTAPLTRTMKETGKSPYFKLDDHWNREGHRVAAEVIANFLKGQNLVKSP